MKAAGKFRRLGDTTDAPRVLSVAIRQEPDDSPDTSWLGKYTDEASDWAIDRQFGEYISELPEGHELPSRGREYRFFLPYAGGEKPGSDDYREYGKQDFARMESLQRGDWSLVGVWAEAEVCVAGVVQTIRSGGLWGIESDSCSHIDDVANEELSALDEQLAALGLSRGGVEVERID